jgi:hypothetical protein
MPPQLFVTAMPIWISKATHATSNAPNIMSTTMPWYSATLSYIISHSFQVHLTLILTEITATVAVTIGILMESDDYPKEAHKIATKMVIFGCAVELLAFLGLFCIDEYISSVHQQRIDEQQDEIISLEKKTALAESEAGKANERAGSLEKEAATANAAAEALRRENNEMARVLVRRRIEVLGFMKVLIPSP